jgi:tight adherence protein C
MFVMGLKENKAEQDVQERISDLSRSSHEKKNPILREKALEKSFSERVFFPVAQTIFDKTQQIIPLSSKSWVRAKLTQAGYTQPHYPKVFLGIQLLACVMLFGVLLTVTTFFGKFNGPLGFIFALVFGLAGYGLPMIWLMQQAKKRQVKIEKSLPDFLDLLVICVEAGLGLDVAIQKISNMRAEDQVDFLKDELHRYTRDVNFGKPRKQALLDLAERTGVEDFQSIINALVQSYEMGTSVGQTLRVQSDSLRVKRLQRAEEKANKVPVKMVMPIYFFLFPAIFVVIFGPIAVIMIKSIGSVFGAMDFGG